MRILLIQGHMFNRRLWEPVSELLSSEGIELRAFSQYGWEAVRRALLEGGVDCVAADLSREIPGFDVLLELMTAVPVRFGYGIEMPKDFTTLSRDDAERMRAYLSKLSADNFGHGIRFLASHAGFQGAVGAVQSVRTDGIYHTDAPQFFESTSDYFDWYDQERPPRGRRSVVGILFYYGQLVERQTREIDALIRTLENHGFLPICVFCEGMYDGALPKERRYPWLKYFQRSGSAEAILNLTAGRLLSKTEDVSLLRELDVPLFQLIRLYNRSERAWREDPAGLPPSSMVYSLVQPELAGAIEPTLTAVQPEAPAGLPTPQGEYVAVKERMESLCRRLEKWIRLRKLPNEEKRITFVLHNAPCRSVEATIGSAVGLDTFESLASVLKAMKDRGYFLEDVPLTGEGLKRTIMTRKAISEFRWTTVDEIVAKGGVLHKTSAEEYDSYLDELPDSARDRLLQDWGAFPGQGMAWNEGGKEYVLVTGLKYGNIRIMVQPKRGCYGPKCTGEVCRILHDPQLAPPHHWIAAYKYIQENSDAVVHFGAHGALEFLPGKSAGLSDACFPEISIGDLPNIYPYCMDVPGEGLMAKRRGRAVIVDHLTPVYRPAETDRETEELADLLEQYQKAVRFREGDRAEVLKERLAPLLKKLKFTDEIDPMDDLPEKADLWIRQIELTRNSFAPEGLHVFGRSPNAIRIAQMLTGMLRMSPEGLPELSRVVSKLEDARSDDFAVQSRVIGRILSGDVPSHLGRDSEILIIQAWGRELYKRIVECSNEIPQLLRALDGKYVEPGPAGSLLMGKARALPTGRNFFAVDIGALPTPAAWEIGKQRADALLTKYLTEEKTFPESVAVNLWSIDGFKSDGEVLCQILYLMGVKPVWASDGRFKKTEPIPLDELKVLLHTGSAISRPRIDVLIQTSGIVRDMLPTFIDILDHAVLFVGDLDEPHEWNFVRKHTDERMRELRETMGASHSMDRIRRLAGFSRILLTSGLLRHRGGFGHRRLGLERP